MKTVILSKNGGAEVLELHDYNIGSPGPDEVLIEHVAIGLNFIDVYHRSGLYPIKLPSGLGAEASGIIQEVGNNVDSFKVGDRIAYSGQPLGAYCSHRIFPTKDLVIVPENIDLEVAATLMIKGLTTFYLLHKTYPVTSGETILFHAAAGGLGQIFCQWAKSLGCRVIGTVGSDEKIEIAIKNGCDHVINYSKENFAERVLEITDGLGVPVVYDGVGKNTLEGSLECLKIRGMMVAFGNASGYVHTLDIKKHINTKGLFFTRPSIAHYTITRKELEDSAAKVFDAILSGKVKIEISKKYSLAEAKKAHEELEARILTGPAVIIPN